MYAKRRYTVRLPVQTDNILFNIIRNKKHIKLNYKEPILYNETQSNKLTITKGNNNFNPK